MRHLILIALVLTAVVLLLAACTPRAYRDLGAYWSRPGSTLPQLAGEADRCYRAAIEPGTTATVAEGDPRLLPRTEPPPGLWRRSPRQAGFEHFDEQLRYEQCMQRQGWEAARRATPDL
jgi:hypothetical protein